MRNKIRDSSAPAHPQSRTSLEEDFMKDGRNGDYVVAKKPKAIALALGLIGAMLLSLGGGLVAANAAVGNPDPNTPRTLTINKQQSGTQTATGAPDGSIVTGGTPIAGVTFTAYKITNVDLTTTTGWAKLEGLTVPLDACATPALTLANAEAATFGTGIVSAATGANGQTTIPNPEFAAYLVCETAAPADVIQRAAPFVVTVPYPMDGGDWVYDVNVYPKNVLVESMTKQANAATALTVGDKLSYTLETTIPSIDSGYYFQHFVIQEPLDTALAPTSTDWATVALKNASGQTVALTEVTDYVLTQTGTTPKTLWVGFTTAGLAKLKATPGGTLSVTFNTVITMPASGQISNTAYLYVATGLTEATTPPTDTPGGTPETSQQVITYYGDYKFEKTDVNNSLALSGATFQVYAATAETQWPSVEGSCAAAVKTGDPITFTVGGVPVTEFTSDANGIVQIPSLYIDSMSSTDGTLPTHDSRCYVLVETAAPAGYVLPATADFPVKVVKGTTTTPLDPSITNTRNSWPGLPLTGAAGQALLIGGGIALILVAAGVIFAKRRSKKSAQS